MSGTVFYGYPGRVWSICYAALGQLSNTLSTTTDSLDTLAMAQAVLATLSNGLAALSANRIAQIWQTELATLYAIEVLPITLNPTDTAFFSARLTALAAAAPALTALVPIPNQSTVAASLAQGVAALPDPRLLEFLGSFSFETQPAGLTNANLSATATSCSNAFADLASAIVSVQGSNKNYLYDLANRFSLEMSSLAEVLGEYPGSPPFNSSSMRTLWNQMFVLPALLVHADLLSGAPNNIIVQQDQLIRFLILTAMQELELLLLSIVKPSSAVITQTTVMIGDSLMDIAARSLGNFERWPEIVAFNKLLPPFVGPNEALGVATWGSKLMLPIPGAGAVGSSEMFKHRHSGTGGASYLFNFLGVDLYFGPINGDFPPWTGDFQMIAGYSNLRWALGRRLQTVLSSLIYHPDYGSRIPPEIGRVQTLDTAGYITAFGKACLLSDPRVHSVLEATTTMGPNFSLQFSAKVQPHGFGSIFIELNEVIGSSVPGSPDYLTLGGEILTLGGEALTL